MIIFVFTPSNYFDTEGAFYQVDPMISYGKILSLNIRTKDQKTTFYRRLKES